MSNLTDAWLSLYDAQTEFIGTSPVVAIVNPAWTVSAVPCIIGEDSAAFSFGLGGQTSGGVNVLQTLSSAWTSGAPAKGDIATVTALPGAVPIVQQVISTVERAGILYISIGDNSANS